MKCKILIVDDEKNFRELLARYLKNHSFSVITASNSKEAIELLSKHKPNLIITDVDLPYVDGFELLKSIRNSSKYSKLPVILISGKKTAEIDMIEGYNKGSDDYLIKPFSLEVLVAKIKSMLKNRNLCSSDGIIKFNELIVNESSKEIIYKDKKIKLTRKEFEILLLFIKNLNRVFSKYEILELIWQQTNNYNPHTVETHISSLRKKLPSSIAKKIINISGYGYKLEE